MEYCLKIFSVTEYYLNKFSMMEYHLNTFSLIEYSLNTFKIMQYHNVYTVICNTFNTMYKLLLYDTSKLQKWSDMSLYTY